MILTVIVFIFTLAILVLTHELGHFLAARRFGVKVEEFGFGIPPRAWGKKIGETIVSLNWLPIGGFVRLLGEDETDSKVLQNERAFAAKSVWQRIAIVVAGVTMNLLLAAGLLWVVLGSQGFKQQIPLLVPFQFVGAEQVNKVNIYVEDVVADAPAGQAGIKAGERVIEFNGQAVESSEQLINQTKENAGKTVQLTLQDDNQERRQVEVVPRVSPPSGQGALGLELAGITVAELNYASPVQKAFAGLSHSYNMAAYSIVILGDLISASFESKNLQPVSQSVAGPVGLTNLTGEILQAKAPLIPYLNFMALLSLNLAIVNILPFPALDGGRLVFLAYEAVFRRKVNPQIEKLVHTAGMALLIALMLLVTFSDIRKLFS